MAKEREPAYGLITVVCWLSVLWLVWITDVVLTFAYGVPSAGVPPHQIGSNLGGYLAVQYGLVPHSPHGLIGIVTAPFLHGGLAHLIANTTALALLFWISLKAYGGRTWVAIVYAMLVGGTLTWVIGDPRDTHIGASGVIFGLLGFLILNGLLRRGCLPLVIAGGILLLYGSALKQTLPGGVGAQISWEMHLGGFLGGLLASIQVRDRGAKDEAA